MERFVDAEDVTFAKYKFRHYDSDNGKWVYSNNAPSLMDFRGCYSTGGKRLVIFSDLHAHNYSLFNSMTPSGISKRVQLQAEVLTFLMGQSLDAQAVFLGDLFHLRNHIDVSVYNTIAYAIDHTHQEITLFPQFLPGNHDFNDKFGDILTFGAIHRMEVLKNETKDCLAAPFMASMSPTLGHIGSIPYCSTVEKFKSSLALRKIDGIDILFMHQMVNEVYLPSGYTMSSGGLSIDDLPQDIPIISGHVHVPQSLNLKGTHGRLIYCGAVMPQSFADINVPGSICLFNWYDRTTWFYEIIKLNVPNFFIIEASSVDSLKSDLEYRIDQDYPASDCYRIDYTDESLLAQFKTLVKESGLVNVKYQLLQGTENSDIERAFDRTKPLTDDTMIDFYVDGNATSLDKTKLKNVGKNIMQKSRRSISDHD